ncbi:MAG: SDR family oxidoreductase [Gammaproteobacteria bacterium]|nr:SDR family oxidoreductase [Gammaproteobacteria bacterium]MDD9963316.1 SDR family oxidoreductase [Gammaproteobacteria bacterium]MDE0270184.1 SDR family oxidoreductase [Gammaproteobacteria bacterium]
MGDAFLGYAGQHVLVVGAATGMGAAAAKQAMSQGARVTAMDVADIKYDVDAALRVDLRDRSSVDHAIGQIDGEVHTVFACAGVADGTPDIVLINFTSQRHLVEALVDTGRVRQGGAIVMISSVAGLSWHRQLADLTDFLDAPGWEAATAWIDAHAGTDNYAFSKMAMSAYVARRAFSLLQRGIRINAIQPGPTDTPLARANADLWLAFGQDYRDAAGVRILTTDEMAATLLFLGSDAASGINGVNLLVDQGQVGAGATDAFASPPIKAMLGLA